MANSGAVDSLNKVIANGTVLAQKLRQFHWFIDGVNFYDLHAEFGKLYDAVSSDVDIWAERVLQLGEYPISTLENMLQLSDIEERDDNQTSDADMVSQTINDLGLLLESLKLVSTAALNDNDRCTDFIAVETAGKYEKALWMLKSFSSSTTKVESVKPKSASKMIEEMVQQSVIRHSR